MDLRKKTIIISMVSLWFCIIILIGSTFAWFKDNVSNKNNKIIAGNLDVELYHTNSTKREKVTEDTKLFVVPIWEPGVVAYENFEVINDGELAFDYEFMMNILGFNTVVETGKSLKDILKVAFIDGEFKENREDLQTLDFSQTIRDIEKKNTLKEKGSSDKFAIIIYWEPTDTDNDYNLNGDRSSNDGSPLYIDFGVKIQAMQKPYEEDSFNNEYDKNIENVQVNSEGLTTEEQNENNVQKRNSIKVIRSG